MQAWWQSSLISVEGNKSEFISAGNNEEKSWEQEERLIHLSRRDYTMTVEAWSLRQTAEGSGRQNQRRGSIHVYLLTREQ